MYREDIIKVIHGAVISVVERIIKLFRLCISKLIKNPSVKVEIILEQHRRNVKLYRENYLKAHNFNNDRLTNIVKECVSLNLAQRKASLLREIDDSIFRAYYAEGGIKYRLDTFLDFAYNKIDDMNTIEIITTAIYNSNIQLAELSLNKLKTNITRDTAKINELMPLTLNEILTMADWRYIDARLDKVEADINSLSNELNKTNVEILNKKLEIIREELDELKPYCVSVDGESENIKKLNNLLTAMKQNVNSYQPKYEYILEEITEFILNPQTISDIKNDIKKYMNVGSYKDIVRDYADKIEKSMLKIENRRKQ
jgi:hypothetical protein